MGGGGWVGVGQGWGRVAARHACFGLSLQRCRTSIGVDTPGCTLVYIYIYNMYITVYFYTQRQREKRVPLACPREV